MKIQEKYSEYQQVQCTGGSDNMKKQVIYQIPLNRSFKKIDPEKLKAYIAEHPDDTQQEVATVFGCCNQAISQAYRRLGITRKKRHSVIKNRAKKK